ncbi:MAG: FHA domain-containing protein [bacterium]
MKKKDELLQDEGMDESSKGTGVLEKEETVPGEEESQVKEEDLSAKVDLPTKEELSAQEELPAQEDARPEKGEESEEKTCLEEVPKITVKKDDQPVLEYELCQELVSIGRRQGNEIVLDDRNVSRQHAQIKREGDAFIIEDMQSTGGTEVNGKKISSQQIYTGDVIKIGDFELYFFSGMKGEEKTVFNEEEEEDRTSFDEDRTKFYEEPLAKLLVKRAENLQGDINLEEEMVIGRGEEADIQLEDSRISRKHCKIALKDKNFVITDLQSANGTFVNGGKISEKALQNGDQIQIGNALFEFQMQQGAQIVPQRGILKRFLKVMGIFGLIAIVFGFIFLVSSDLTTSHTVILSKLWEKQANGPIQISAAIGDLNNDVFNDIVVADAKGFIHAFDGRTGGSIWNKPYSTGWSILSAPVLGDVNQKDGRLDVILGTQMGQVYTIDGSRGNLIWASHVIKGAVSSSPALTDLNSDDVLDVVVGSKDNFIHALDGKQGGEIWSFNAKGEVTTNPSLTDIDGDGTLDVIIGSPGNVYALSGLNGKRLWVYQSLGNPSSAAIGHFNDDLIEDVAVSFAKELVVLNGKTGAVLWTWNIPLITEEENLEPISPALVDFNQDHYLDVVCVSGKGHVYSIDGASRGNRYFWDFSTEGIVPSTPSILDFDQDGTPDVSVTSQKGIIYLINGKDGHLLTQFELHEETVSPVAIADVNANKLVDLVVGTLSGKLLVVETNTKCDKNEVFWSALGRDRLHTARVQ